MSALESELKALEEAFSEIGDLEGGLRVNAVRLKDKEDANAAWQIEDTEGNKLFVVLSGSDVEQAMLQMEAEVGQFLSVDDASARALLELNYTQAHLAYLALRSDGVLTVIHRRWFEDTSKRSALDAIAEVWNTAQSLRDTLKPQKPGLA